MVNTKSVTSSALMLLMLVGILAFPLDRCEAQVLEIIPSNGLDARVINASENERTKDVPIYVFNTGCKSIQCVIKSVSLEVTASDADSEGELKRLRDVVFEVSLYVRRQHLKSVLVTKDDGLSHTFTFDGVDVEILEGRIVEWSVYITLCEISESGNSRRLEPGDQVSVSSLKLTEWRVTDGNKSAIAVVSVGEQPYPIHTIQSK